MSDLVASHEKAFGRAPVGVWSAPGRVNLIGEHTDYNDGFVMPFALPHRARVAVSFRDDERWGFCSVDRSETHELGEAELVPGLDGWHAYLAGVVWALREAGHTVGGLDITLTSNVPVGAGLSSSAALECAMVAACCDLFGLEIAPIERAKLARIAENEFVGAPTGLMDQAASTLCTEGNALFLDCRSTESRQVPFEPASQGLELLVLDTNTPHALVDSEYATRRTSCEEASRLLGVAALRDVTDLDAALDQLPDEEMRRRVRHVVTENARVTEAVAVLEGGDIRGLAPLLDASHASMRDDFEITVETVDTAVETAREAGALGARMTGGGFGGCIIALCPAGAGDGVGTRIAEQFAARGFAAPAWFIAEPSQGAGKDDPGAG